MKSVAKRAAQTVLMCGLLLLPAAVAQAQGRMNQAQYLNNLMTSAQMPGPAWGGGFGAGAFNPAFAGGGGFVNPYTPFGGGIGSNPYTPGGGNFGGGGGYGAPYGGYLSLIPPQGFFLMGTADIMKAYGSVVTADQQARIMAEQAKQAHYDTLKKRFEYEMFIKANTIPYSEVQAKIAKNILARMQRAANPNEVISGKSLNTLLHDLEGAQGKKVAMEPISLSEDILKHINVTTGRGNIGLLRNDGRFAWPPALLDIVPAKDREEIEIQAQALVQNAIDGKVPGNVLKDLKNTLDKMFETLRKKYGADEVGADNYLVAKKFLEDFNSALIGLGEPGNAVAYFNFQKWATGTKTIQEVADYFVAKGLTIAPAVQGDENAYRAVQSALAAYDLAYNRQLAQPINGKDE